MKNPDGLAVLIKSLNTAEKSAFRKTALYSGNNKYLGLFDELDKTPQTGFDDMLIMKKLKYVNKNTYYVAKNYLYESLLRNLCVLNLETSLEDRLYTRIMSIKILYRKTLFSKALELLRKTKKLCIKSGNYVRLLELLKWEKNLVIEGTAKGDKARILALLQEEEKNVLKGIDNISTYRHLFFEFSSFAAGSGKLKKKELQKKLAAYMNNPLIKNESNAFTLVSRITLYDIKAYMNILMNQSAKNYLVRKKMLQLMETNTEFRNENLTNYVILLYNFANTCFEAGKLSETGDCIEKLKNVTLKHSRRLSTNVKVLLSIGSLRLEIKNRIKENKIEQSAHASEELIATVRKYEPSLTEEEMAQSFVICATSLLLNKDFSKALSIINAVTGYNSENLKFITFTESRLLQILLLYELESFDTVEYNIKSLTRYLKKNEGKEINNGTDLLKRVLNLLKRVSDRKDIKSEFTEIKAGENELCSEIITSWVKNS